jgi:tetratricopeptide (TPR) repeat protein
VATLRGHDAAVFAVAFSPDSSRLISGGGDGALRLWDVSTHESILALQGHQGRVTSVAFTPDGSRIVSGSADGTVRVWESRLVHDADAALLVGRLRATLRFSSDVMARVRTDSTLDPDVRTAALAIAEARGDDPSALNDESWRTVKGAGLAPGAYEVALRLALLANEAAPWNLEFIRTLGAAYYRVQRYDEGLSTMTRAAGLRSEPNVDDVVFIAMAHHQLRHGPEAREALARVRTMLAAEPGRHRLSAEADLRALYEEATALIGR